MTHSFPTRRSSDRAERELARRPAVRRCNVYMCVARLQIACAVSAVDQIGDQFQRRGPFGALRFRRRLAELGFFIRSEHRSEEHKSEVQSLMRISYAVFCLKKKTN